MSQTGSSAPPPATTARRGKKKPKGRTIAIVGAVAAVLAGVGAVLQGLGPFAKSDSPTSSTTAGASGGGIAVVGGQACIASGAGAQAHCPGSEPAAGAGPATDAGAVPAGSSGRSSGTTKPPGSVTIENTWNPELQRPDGVRTYAGPHNNSTDKTPVGSYAEHQTVSVDCLVTNGRSVHTDPLQNGSVYQSSTWLRLNPPTAWLPVIFTSLYKPDGTLTQAVPTCPS